MSSRAFKYEGGCRDFDAVILKMTLCDACSVLPIRDVLRESVGDEASTNRLQAWNEPRARYTDKFGAPFLKLNRTLGVLESNASDCPICDLICVGLKGSLRFHDPTKWNAQSEIWLRVSRGALYVWLGSEILPLDNVGGCVGISATKGRRLSIALAVHLARSLFDQKAPSRSISADTVSFKIR